MKIIDLSLTYNQDISGYSDEQATTKTKDGWNAKWLRIYSHSGTHMDAPFHFEASDETIDQMPVDRFVGRAWVVDCGAVQAQELLTVAHLGTVAEKFKRGESLLLKTGWSHHYQNRELYRNGLPRVSEALARWCGEKGVNMLAVEPPSVADVNNLPEVTLIHEILLSHGVIIVEGICNLDALTSPQVTLCALPLKIKNGDGAPARVVAIEASWT
ncbi:MAG: cyclase family protein [Bacteroidota bacterium]